MIRGSPSASISARSGPSPSSTSCAPSSSGRLAEGIDDDVAASSRRRAGRRRSAAAGRRSGRALRRSAGSRRDGPNSPSSTPSGDDLDPLDAERAQLGRAAILAQREHARRSGDRAARNSDSRAARPAREPVCRPHLRERPLDIDGRKIGHVGRRPAPSPGWRLRWPIAAHGRL